MRNAQITKMSPCPSQREEFGPDVFDPHTGELDRAALRGIIFEDEEQRRKLNRITHPEIYKGKGPFHSPCIRTYMTLTSP